MANFNTHILSAAACGSLAATVCMKLVGLAPADALVLTLAAIAGGVLPDIDLKHSTPGKALFTGLGTLLALSWLFASIHEFAAIELWVVAGAIFLCVRYLAWRLFDQFTVHRGALHSLAAGLMFSFAASAGSFHFLGLDPLMSWLVAGFLGAGFFIHLALDELFAVDIMGARVNNRFGSALKIIDTKRLFPSCLVLFAALLTWFWTPTLHPLTNAWETISANSATPWADALLPAWLNIDWGLSSITP